MFNTEDDTLSLANPIESDLSILGVLRSSVSQQYQLECGEIRPLINWFKFM